MSETQADNVISYVNRLCREADARPSKQVEMPEWQRQQSDKLMSRLSEWREKDHEDAITLTRSEVICILETLASGNAQ